MTMAKPISRPANPVSDFVLVAGMIVTVSQIFQGYRAPREAGL